MSYSTGSKLDRESAISELIKDLSDELGGEGYVFSIDKEVDPGAGFTRVRLSRSGGGWDAFLDLRLGVNGPLGQSIEMSSSKSGNYGVPGYTRMRKSGALSKPLDTFSDFLRASYSYSMRSGKSVQEAFWHIYQHGDENRDLPVAGSVLTDSSSSGMRNFVSNVIRSRALEVHEEEGWGWKERQAYIDKLLGRIKSGSLTQLLGYGLELTKHKALVPITHRTWSDAEQGVMSQTLRGVDSDVKSLTTIMESRDLADVVFAKAKGSPVTKLASTKPEEGEGIRYGYTRSSVILPGEHKPRNVLSQRVVLADQPDSPGAAYVSKESAFKTSIGGVQYDITDIGTKMTLGAKLNIESVDELQALLQSGGISFENTSGQKISAGRSSFMIGHMATTSPEVIDELKKIAGPELLSKAGLPYSPEVVQKIREGGQIEDKQIDAWEKLREIYSKAITVNRRAYPLMLEKSTLYVPAYMYYDEKTGKRVFANVPVGSKEGTSTEAIIKSLKEKFGDSINVVSGSKIGSGVGGSVAEMHVETKAYALTPTAMKTSGFKAYLLELDKLRVKLQGVPDEQVADILTQEAKIPARVLMSSFGVMNKETQKKFLSFMYDQQLGGTAATPEDANILSGILGYIDKSYSKNTVGINLEKLAEKWYGSDAKTGVKRKAYTADILFNDFLKVVLDIGKKSDEGVSRSMYDNFGIGILSGQDMAGLVYSQAQKDHYEEVMKEVPNSENLVSFDPINTGGGDPQYRMRFKVKGGENIMLTAGVSFVPEYPFKKAYLNSKAIMSLIDNYPNISKSIGLLSTYTVGGKEVTGWTGPLQEYSKDLPDKTRVGWFGMAVWKGMQEDIDNSVALGSKISIPSKAIKMTSEFASWLLPQLDALKGSTKDQVEELEKVFSSLPGELFGLDKDIDARESFLFDKSTSTLLPRLTDISALEVYKQGARSGYTSAFKFKNYTDLLRQTLISLSGGSDRSIIKFLKAKQSMMTRVEKAFIPDDARERGGEVYRNVLGVDVTGVAGGRYQGLTQIEPLEAFASDSYIQRILASNRRYSRSEVDKITKWLNSTKNAFLPVMVQRYPDVSGKMTWLPMMLRSKKNFALRGVTVPERINRDVFYMSQVANEYFVGDFDADPAMQLLLPLEEAGEGWDLQSMYKKEFESNIKHYGALGATLNKHRGEMFGSDAVNVSAELKQLPEYVTGATVKSSLVKRVENLKTVKLNDAIDAATVVAEFKAGMGVAYNRRTLTEDIFDTVLSSVSGGAEREEVRNKAYESGARPYQLYLDRAKKMAGGKTAFETFLNSISISTTPDVKTDITGEAQNWQLGFITTGQGQANPSVGWKDWIFQGNASGGSKYTGTPLSFLSNLASNLAFMNPDFMSNAMMAWGLSKPGREAEVLKLLEGARGGDRRLAVINMIKSKDSPLTVKSPYAMATVYSAVRRALKDNPSMAEHNEIMLPWMDDDTLTSISDIVETPEYRLADMAERLVVKKRGVLSPKDIETMMAMVPTDTKNMPRMMKFLTGIARAYESVSGGVGSFEQIEQISNIRETAIGKVISSIVGKQSKPAVHMSELGAFMGSEFVPRHLASEWSPSDTGIRAASAWKAIARSIGYGWTLEGGSAAGEDHPLFVSKDMDVSFAPKEGKHKKLWGKSAMEAGTLFEKEYAKQLPATGIYHIGATRREAAITLSLPEMELRGTPDFIGITPDGRMIISDTKLAWEDPRKDPYTKMTVKSYKNRLQVLSYAAAFQKAARELNPDEWRDFLSGNDESPGIGIPRSAIEEMEKMQQAAASGKFKLSITPGHVNPREGKGGGKGEVDVFDEIEIDYNEQSAAKELSAAAQYARQVVFGKRMYKLVSEQLYKSATHPGYVPEVLAGQYKRSSAQPQMSKFNIMKTIPKVIAGIPGLSGGGTIIGGSEPQRFRVGEGGQEEIIIEDGNVTIVPTHELAENAHNRSVVRGALGGGHSRFNVRPRHGSGLVGHSGLTRSDINREQDILAGVVGGEEEDVSGIGEAAGFTAKSEVPVAKVETTAQFMKEFSGFASDLVDEVGEKFDSILKKTVIPVEFKAGGRKKIPRPFSEEVNFESAILGATGFIKSAQEREGVLRESMRSYLQESSAAGEFAKVKEFSPKNTKVTSAALLGWAKTNLGEKEWEELATITKGQTTNINVGVKSLASLERMIQENPEKFASAAALLSRFNEGAGTAALDIQKFFESNAGKAVPTEEYAAVQSIGIVSQQMAKFKSSKLVDQEVFEKLFKSVTEYSKTLDDLTAKQAAGMPAIDLMNKAMRQSADYEISFAEARRSVARGKLVDRRLVGPEEKEISPEQAIKRLVSRGYKPSEEDIAAVHQYAEATQKVQELGEAQRERTSGAPFVRGAQGIARHLLGGWGIFYMSTLAGMGMGSYRSGYQQAEEREEAFLQSYGQFAGTDIPRSMMTERRYQALIASGGNIPYKEIRGLSARFEASGLQDVAGAALTGIGGSALALFGGNIIAAGGETAGLAGLKAFGVGLGKAAPAIGVGLTLASLAFNEAAYAANPEATAASVAASRMRSEELKRQGLGFSAFVEDAGSLLKQGALKKAILPDAYLSEAGKAYGEYWNRRNVWEGAKENQWLNVFGGFKQLFMPPSVGFEGYNAVKAGKEDWEKYSGTTLADRYEALADRMFESRALPEMTEQEKMWVSLTESSGTEKYGPYSEQIRQAVTARSFEARDTGIVKDLDRGINEKLMAGYSIGKRYDEASAALGTLMGIGVPTPINTYGISAELAKRDYTNVQVAEVETLSNFISKLTLSVREFSGSDVQSAVDKLEQFKEKYKNVLGTLKEEPVGIAEAAFQQAKAFGLPTGDLGKRIASALAKEKNEQLTPEEEEALTFEASVVQGRVSRWQQMGMRIGQMYGTAEQMSTVRREYGSAGVMGEVWGQGLLGADPRYLTAALSVNAVSANRYVAPDAFGRIGNLNTLAIGGQDITGRYKGTGLFQESLYQGQQTPAETAALVFGEGWQSGEYGDIIGQTLIGGEELFGQKYGGFVGMQIRQMRDTKEYQRNMQGIQAAQRQLQYGFQTGVGINAYAGSVNPQTGQPFGFNTGQFNVGVSGVGSFTSTGGGFWGLEDASRALANMQQTYSFQTQQRQMQMQSSQFYENIGLNRQQSLMQRDWSMQDWGTQDRNRAMQWGWKQEDFAENIRFMTGRDRRLAERQMKRETTMYGLEGEQIDRQRERQKEMWGLEDDRYQMQIQHFEETKALQEEVNRVNKEFYLQNKELQDEQIRMQRAYWIEQQKLETASIEEQKKYNETMQKYQEIQLALNLAVGTAREKAAAFAEVLNKDFVDAIIAAANTLATEFGFTPPFSSQEKEEEGEYAIGAVSAKALGGYVLPNLPYLVNEAGAEVFVPDKSGVVVPLYGNSPWQGASVMAPSEPYESSMRPVSVSIYIGDKYLGEYIIDTVDKELRI